MKYLFFLIPVLLVLALATSTEVFAEPTKIKHEGGGEIWQLNATQFVYRSAPTYVFNNATIYSGENNAWVAHDLDILGSGDFDVLSGLIGTKFIGSTVTHYNPLTDIEVGTDKLHLFKNNGATEVLLTFVNRTHTTGTIAESYTIGGEPVTDTRDTITITENWTSPEADVIIDYFFDEGKPLKHTFTVTRTISGSETYQLYHEFDLVIEEIEITSDSQGIEIFKLKAKTSECEIISSLVNSTSIISCTLDKATFGETLRTIRFVEPVIENLILGEIITPDITDPAFIKFQELFIDVTTDPTFTFRYGNFTVSQSQSFQLDPDTFTSSDPTRDLSIRDTGNNGSCGGTTVTELTGERGLFGPEQSSSSTDCFRTAVEWDITSIDDLGTITDVDFLFDVEEAADPRNGHIRHMSSQPSVASLSTIFTDIGDGTLYINNNGFSLTTGNNKLLDLGTTADSDLEGRLVANWFAIGIQSANEAQDATPHYSGIALEELGTATPKPTLEVTFTFTPVYVIDLLDVFESSSTTLETGTAICLNVDLEIASSCPTTLNAGSTYRFEIEVDNTGNGAGSPTTLEFRDVIAASDVLGTIPVGNILNSGCSTNINWVESVVTNDARAVPGTTCSIPATTGSVEFWFIITLDTDANDGTGTFFINDGSVNDVSTTTTFTVNTSPNYIVDLLDVFESSSTTLESGTPICLDVDLEIAASCPAALNAGSTYRFEVEVDNTGEQAGSPTSFDLDAMIAINDVLGSIPVGNILNSGCSTNTNWAESIVGGTDARASSGTTCSIAIAGTAEFWIIITLDGDANDGTGTFTVTDGTITDTSTTTTFTVNTSPSYSLTNLDVYQSGTRTLNDGTAVCTGVSLTSPSACSGNIISGQTYQFQATVTNTGEQTGSPTSEEFRDVVATSDVLGTIPITSLDTGCNDDGTDRVWTDSIVTDDAVGTSGTLCTIEANTGSEIYYWIVTIDPDAGDDSGTFFVTDGTNSDVSTLTTFSLNPPPNPITDLAATNPTFSTIDLAWTEPGLNGGTLEGYQINFTTPFGNPLSVITNNTNTTTTSVIVGNLLTATDYSFRVSAWTNNGNNAAGNIANQTTLGESFTVGAIAVNQTNPDILDIRFVRSEVNSTTTQVDVLYTNTYNLTCTVDHKFARTSINYSNLDVVTFDSSTSNSTFQFTNHTNDLVSMHCFDENDTTRDGRFQVIWSSFPLLDQFANFRSGVYGTDGVIGAIDFITLAVIIFSMIGLNRVNESVGVIFNIALLGALAFFGIIELPTIIFGALVVVLIFTVASTRKQ